MFHLFEITVGTHFFKVTPRTDDDRAKEICYNFVRKFVKVDVQGSNRVITTFAASNKARTWFRFHFNALADFNNHLFVNNIPKEQVKVTYLPEPVVENCVMPIREKWVAKDYQEPIIDYLIKPIGTYDAGTRQWTNGGARTRMVAIEPGRGKTFCAVKAVCELGYRVVVIVLAGFVEKWVKDLCNIMDIKPKEIVAVQGGAAMQALTEMAVTKGSMDPYKAVVISNRTFENYLRAYESYGSEMDTLGYMVPPEELWTKLGIGVRLIDEVHMQFHANFRVDLYTHVKHAISLSATLLTRDEAMSRMYKIAYPQAERYKEPTTKKYIDSFGVFYRVNPNWNVKTSHRGMSSYSHTAFEDSILKNKQFLNGYAKMLGDYLQKGYMANYKPGNKAIVFAASVEMCGKLAEKLQERFPNKTVKRYVAEDPYQANYLDPDIRVTTIGSGGTGHDIPGLTDNHMTTAIDSLQANIQTMGRLRDIPDQQTRFYFYSCEQVRKHLNYHDKKKSLMRERAKSYTPLFYGTIGETGWMSYT